VLIALVRHVLGQAAAGRAGVPLPAG
jgi:hypothetical protein